MNSLSVTLAALSDSTRRAILVRLKAGPASVNELAQPFRVSQQAISKHLAQLERAQLIDKRRDGRQQICRLRPGPLRDVASWVAQYERFWGEAFDRLDALLHETHSSKNRSRRS